jgi:hypothetical protein
MNKGTPKEQFLELVSMRCTGRVAIYPILMHFAFFALMLIPAQAQTADSLHTGFFVCRDFGRYFVSDMYSPVTKLQPGLSSNAADYNNDPGRTASMVILQEFTLGTDIPIYTGRINLAERLFHFSVSGSLSSVILFDILNPKSSPILNVDYRLSLPDFQLKTEFQGSKRMKNILLRIMPLQHESTHIGDELTLYRARSGFPITRVNVSYESGEASLTLNDPGYINGNNHAMTLGGKYLYKNHKTDGFYTMQPWEGDTSLFVPSQRRLEGYLRYQYDGPDSHFRIGRFYPVVSAELRQRVKFGYPYFHADPSASTGFREITEPEKLVTCINVYAGWRETRKAGETGCVGAYFRYYSGINPHGQFRNIPRYTFFGIAFVFEN